jgi:hypothetical protein
MRLPRMTTRRWIVAVALMGLELALIKAVATRMGPMPMPRALDWIASALLVCGSQALIALSLLKSRTWSVLTYRGPLTHYTDLGRKPHASDPAHERFTGR